MKNDLKISKNYIENLKKELDNTELLSQRYLRVKDTIIQEEVTVLELEENIRERKEDTERRNGRKIYKILS